MANKRSELACILRQLADYVDRHPDEDLAPIFERAAALTKPEVARQKIKPEKKRFLSGDAAELAKKLQTLPSREEGISILCDEAPNRQALEMLARLLNLPVQKDDSVEKLRTKIVENTIGSRLRSEAIQDNSR
ncbi:MAG TPA: hypothetical protein VGE39_22665 [Prosthecobacter sp.]